MALIDDLAEKFAFDVIAAQNELGEDRLFMEISKYIGASSPSLEEAFLTACRLHMAEIRGRAFFDKRVEELRRAKAQAEGGDDA